MVFISVPVRVGDELWLYYSAWDGDHLTWNRDNTPYYPNRVRIGRTARAVLRWNGYLSLRGADTPGELTTPLLRTSGRQLVLNAAATKGSVRVEVQDAVGTPLPGFGLADCERLTGDGIAQTVRWAGNARLPVQAGNQPLRLRFEVQRADLYGFQFAI
jgi:hypothetical protein